MDPELGMPADTDADRLEHALEMWADGVCMMRESLCRRFPAAPAEEIEVALDLWLATRPGAEGGDGEGVAVAWPRPRR